MLLLIDQCSSFGTEIKQLLTFQDLDLIEMGLMLGKNAVVANQFLVYLAVYICFTLRVIVAGYCQPSSVPKLLHKAVVLNDFVERH